MFGGVPVSSLTRKILAGGQADLELQSGRSGEGHMPVLLPHVNPLSDVPTPRRLLCGSVAFLDRRGCPSLKEGGFALAGDPVVEWSCLSPFDE